MKKAITILIVLCIFILSAFSCGKIEEVIITESTESEEIVTTESTTEETTVMEPTGSEKVVVTESTESTTVEIINPEKKEIDYDEITSEYIKSDIANEEFVYAYNNANNVKYIPIYGTYLENTNSFLCMFFENGEFIGAKSLSYDEITKAVDLSKYKVNFRNITTVKALSDEHCYAMLKSCMEQFPEFEITGVVCNTLGYQTTYPIGIQKGKDTIKYYAGELLNFRLVDPFHTAAEGAALFEEYLERKAEIKSQIPIYKWKKEKLDDDGYINPFQNSSARFNQGVDAYAYLDDYDDIIAVPLIDEDGREDRYALHLLYYHNNLLAELILEYLPNEEVRLRAVYENVAEKDEATGEYDYLEKSEYQRVYEEYIAANPDSTIRAIAFDGEQYKVMK